jgi:hypothetical protein
LFSDLNFSGAPFYNDKSAFIHDRVQFVPVVGVKCISGMRMIVIHGEFVYAAFCFSRRRGERRNDAEENPTAPPRLLCASARNKTPHRYSMLSCRKSPPSITAIFC